MLSGFRTELYACLTSRADALFALCDALLCTDGPVRALVGLALAPEHRRRHGASYSGINRGRIDVARLPRVGGCAVAPRERRLAGVGRGRLTMASAGRRHRLGPLLLPCLRPRPGQAPDGPRLALLGRRRPGDRPDVVDGAADAIRLEPGTDLADRSARRAAGRPHAETWDEPSPLARHIPVRPSTRRTRNLGSPDGRRSRGHKAEPSVSAHHCRRGASAILGLVAEDNTQHQGDVQGQVTPVRAEVERVLAEAERRERSAHQRVRLWGVMDIALGFPAAVLAGISGAAGLASPDARVPAALLALVSAGLTAGAGFLRSDVRRAENRRSRLAWAEVEAGARLLLAQETQLDRDAVQKALRKLLDSRTSAIAIHTEDAPGRPPS